MNTYLFVGGPADGRRIGLPEAYPSVRHPSSYLSDVPMFDPTQRTVQMPTDTAYERTRIGFDDDLEPIVVYAMPGMSQRSIINRLIRFYDPIDKVDKPE